MSITNGFLGDYAQVLAQMRGPSPPDRAGAGAGAGAGTEVECRSALLTAVAELTPELRPVRMLLEACRDDPARFQEDDNDQDQGEDQDKDGEADVTAEAPAEAVNFDDPAPLSTEADAVPEPACRGSEEFPPFQPEKIADQSAQLPQSVMVSINSPAARVEGAKSAPSGGEGDTDAVENRRSGPGSQSTPWEELTPQARSAIEARNRDTMAEIKMRVESIRSDHRLRE